MDCPRRPGPTIAIPTVFFCFFNPRSPLRLPRRNMTGCHKALSLIPSLLAAFFLEPFEGTRASNRYKKQQYITKEIDMHELATVTFVVTFFAVCSAIALALLHQLIGRRLVATMRDFVPATLLERLRLTFVSDKV